MSPMPAPQILIIAGHDPSGAGVHADIETCAAHHCQAISAVTALTAQNTQAVTALNPTPASVLRSQLTSISKEDFHIAACKIGLVCTEEQIDVISQFINELDSNKSSTIPIIIDPIIRATSGRELLTSATYDRYQTALLPHATLITPNQFEAQMLSSNTSIDDAGKVLCERYSSDVLITGTDAKKNPIEHHLFESSVRTNTFTCNPIAGVFHGSGCTLSSAVAANLAHGLTMSVAVEKALTYTWNAVAAARPNKLSQQLPDRFYNFHP